MTETTYTMFVANDAGADEIVARNVTAVGAFAIAPDHGRAVRSTIACRSGRAHRVYEIARRLPNEGREIVIAVRVPRSFDEKADACIAAHAIVGIFLSDPNRFRDGGIMSDDDYTCRVANRENDA
jgi:hypothetical protein